MVLAIAWEFLIFALTYGNCLNMQSEYTNTRVQMILEYLNEHYSEEKQYILQLDGNIGFAPSIRNKLKESPLLNRLIPKTLGGGWAWSEYKLYRYYGLPQNYTALFAWMTDEETDLRLMDLPLKENTMWFDVYSDGINILIRVKP